MFRKYMHIERFGNTEVNGIELGECLIFPKLDGTNASIYWDDDVNRIKSGARNRELTLQKDNAGFYKYVLEQNTLLELVENNRALTFYGEFLVPHSLKTYIDDAWKKFYIFDVYDNTHEKYLHYDYYTRVLDEYNIEYIRPLCKIVNATYEKLQKIMQENTYLIKDGEGCGEGIVLKNYNFENKYGRNCFAKMITNNFKEKHIKEMGVNKVRCKEMIEQQVVDEYINLHFVNKVYDKITLTEDGWTSKYIPRLLNTVYYDLVREELWDIVKKKKNPIINFKTLQSIITIKIKELKPELF